MKWQTTSGWEDEGTHYRRDDPTEREEAQSAGNRLVEAFDALTYALAKHSDKPRTMQDRLQSIANAEPDCLRRALKKAVLGLELDERERGEVAMLYEAIPTYVHSAESLYLDQYQYSASDIEELESINASLEDLVTREEEAIADLENEVEELFEEKLDLQEELSNLEHAYRSSIHDYSALECEYEDLLAGPNFNEKIAAHLDNVIVRRTGKTGGSNE